MENFSRSLSKSKLIAYRQCHKRLWLEVHHPERKVESPATLQNFQIGHQVGDIARQIYDPENLGALIDIEALGFEQAFQRTAELLKAPQANPVFEAGCKAAGGLAFADVLLPIAGSGKNQWRMIEVKASTRVKPYHEDDIAIQSYIFRRAGISLSQVALAHIDNTWVYAGDEMYQGLLKEVDFTKEAFGREAEVESWIKQAHDIIATDLEPVMDVGPHCHSPYDCSFEAYCRKDEPKPDIPAQWLPRLQSKAPKQHIQQGNPEMADMPDALLNSLQQRVKTCTLNNQPFVDYAGAQKAMAEWRFPLLFLDFETIQFSVPYWPGTRPYQQVPFQYSLHCLTDAGELSHAEFLAQPDTMPAAALAEQLIRDCGKEGSIIAYNAGFERRCIYQLAEWVPEQATELKAIASRVVDLLPVARAHYYHPSQKGSWSLKQVLPAIVPELSYAELDGVQNGGMAQTAFAEWLHPATTKERQKTLTGQLLRYCALDTVALVKIWQFFAQKNE
jgi:hypothetical protein